MKMSVIGSGRWGTFLAWYSARIFERVTLYGRATSTKFSTLQTTRANEYLSLSDNITLSSDLSETLQDIDYLIISIGAQNLRNLAKELNQYDLQHKTLILCMKGIEKDTGKRLTEIIKEEITQDIELAVWLGPGHVQEFTNNIPNCMVIDSNNPLTTDKIISRFGSELIRFYYGQDLIGTEVGAATKNIIGIAAGILDGLSYSSLKGALMSRGSREVSRLIEALGGNPLSAYGLGHLGDYEATLFSSLSHNRRYGESLVSGTTMTKLAEGVETIKATYQLSKSLSVPMPITTALYRIVFENNNIKQTFNELFLREKKPEFLNTQSYEE